MVKVSLHEFRQNGQFFGLIFVISEESLYANIFLAFDIHSLPTRTVKTTEQFLSDTIALANASVLEVLTFSHVQA
jgi:hypothetical protein